MPTKIQALGRAGAVLVTALVTVLAIGSSALAQNAGEHWVATWAASPQPRAGGPPRAAQPGAPAPLTSFKDQTVRMIVHTSIGGNRVRVEFSNAYGTAPLALGAAHVALHTETKSRNRALLPTNAYLPDISAETSHFRFRRGRSCSAIRSA